MSESTRVIELLAAFDDALTHTWESLESAIEGVSEDEALYQHSAYRNERAEAGYPPAGTIRWHVVHLAHCYRNYTARIIARPKEPTELPPPSCSSFSEAAEQLLHYRSEFRETVAALRDEELDEPLSNGKPVIDLVRSTVRHDVWHASQIALVRRLWRASGGVNTGSTGKIAGKV